MRPIVMLTAAAATAGLITASCNTGVQAPREPGACYAMEASKDGAEPTFNIVARDQPQIEQCAARLEEMRMRFLRLGGNRREITGAYQGQFIFIDRAGVSFSKSLNGNRFIALARTGDGRLAVPGAIVRDSAGDPTSVK